MTSVRWANFINLFARLVPDCLAQMRAQLLQWMSTLLIGLIRPRIALFPQQGYRLRVEITPIAASLERPATIFDQSLVELVLEDKNGHRLEFSSVGSAVSYLFPVVFAWLESKTSYVMQPELHCHPALQLVLGDILVQRIACRKMGEEGGSSGAQHQYFVETHSEHIILRILRRIRECSEGKGPAGYEISPEDVSCVYVDPTEKGSIVTNIELTKGGDFFQDWLNGFFSERAGELFEISILPSLP